jgi:protein phosphatase 2C family protein 2/3
MKKGVKLAELPLKRGVSRIRRKKRMPTYQHQLKIHHKSNLAVGATSVQGRRFTNQDVMHISLSSKHTIVGVFDGHNGDRAAKMVNSFLGPTFSSLLLLQQQQQEQNITVDSSYSNVEQVIKKTFQQVEEVLVREKEKSGTCASVLVIGPNVDSAWVANLGDSRVVLGIEEDGKEKRAGERGSSSSKKDRNYKRTTVLKAIPLSKEHRPSDPEERSRIESSGGQVVRVSYSMDDPGLDRVQPGGLAISRALGGVHYKNRNGVSSIPDINQVVSDGKWTTNGSNWSLDDFILIGCDGIFDVMTNDEIVELTKKSFDNAMTRHQIIFHQELNQPKFDSHSMVVRSRDLSKYTIGQMVDLPVSQVVGFVSSLEPEFEASSSPSSENDVIETVDGAGFLHVRKIPESLWSLNKQEDPTGALTAWSNAVVCQEIVNECLRRGADDNLTLMLVKKILQ